MKLLRVYYERHMIPKMPIKHGQRRGAKARSGPSLPESRQQAKVVSVRLAAETRAALDALAARWGLSRSATVTRLVTEAAGRQPPKGGDPSP